MSPRLTRQAAPAGLEPLSPPQRHQLLVEWNDSRRAYGGPRLLHRLFEARAAATPDAVAVVSGAGHLTYGRLDRLAERLARHLRSLGVGQEAVVGLCLDGGLELPAAMLAVLKAGGAWVPLDPAYPARRLRFMARDAGVSVLVTRGRLSRRFAAGSAQPVCLDAGWSKRLGGRVPGDPGEPIDERNPAYLIHTSGSTGRPKGVLVDHRAVVNRLRWSQEATPLSAADRVLQQASQSFDFSVWELFGTWLAGGTVVQVPGSRRRDVERLVELIHDAGVTVVHFVPALLEEFLEVAGSEEFPWLRLLFSGGESLSAELRDRTLARLDVELVNQYGPTEAAIDATFWPCHRGGRRGSVPIGRPIANTRIHVLDEGLRPAPAGVMGELYIAGEGLARGYAGRPGPTAAGFLPDPWAPEPGGRLYRSGDLARHLEDGSVLLTGRRDHQVQVRGFRIELGEIEAALEAHPEVRRAVVMAESATGGDPWLVAFLVGACAGAVPAGTLRGWLLERLPDHMIPAIFQELDRLPTTATGKVDRPALSRRARRQLGSGRSASATFSAPRSPQEEILAQIWSEVLGIGPIGIHDHFFELGGHSLLAGRVLSRIRRLFHLDLPVGVLFERPTVAALARGLKTARGLQTARGVKAPAMPVLAAGPRPPVLPLSFAQERLWFLDRLEPLSPAYNLPSAWHLKGRLDAGALERALEEITRRHEVLRTRFPSSGGKPYQEIAPRPSLRLPIVDLEGLAADHRQAQARSLAAAEAVRAFDLVRGPLVRAVLLRLRRPELAPATGADEHVLLLTLHHAVSDAWSQGILRRELAALYETLVKGGASPLPELPVQIADVALWQRRWLEGEALASRLAFWRRQLGERPATLELPVDRPRPARPSHRGASHRWVLGESLTAALHGLGASAGGSLYMTLMAAFMALLHRLSHQREILVGSPIAGRDHEETEGLIGLFVNTLVMRGTFNTAPSDGAVRFAELLAQVRETALAAYAHQELPFEKVVEELQPERDPSRNPLFQVTLVLHNAPESPPRLAGLEVAPLEVEVAEMARVDLALYLRERSGSLAGTMIGARDLFDASTVARFCGHFESLLRGAVADPDRRVSGLPILAPSQRHQLLVEWADGSGSASPPSAVECIHQLIEAQARRVPEAVALCYEDRQLSFRQLDLRAGRLSRALQIASPDTPVIAICLHRGLGMVVAVLAVLKAGVAYLFLDPAHPRRRRRQLLADARVRRLVTSGSLAPDFAGWDGEILLSDSRGLGENGAPRRPSRVSARHPAYVTYTSGSTGRAKGVVATHAGAVSYLRFVLGTQGLGPADVVLQIASLTFDRSVRDLFAPLVAGARAVISVARAEDPDEILREVAAGRVTFLPAMVPSLLRQLAAAVGAKTPPTPSLRAVLFAGESLTGSDCRLARALFGHRARLVNLYGPTEGTCTSSSWTPAAGRDEDGVVAIGRPHPHVSIYLFDRSLESVPPGCAGELALAGAGLARGYLGRPAATAPAFVPDPFAGRPGERLYRTGDLARHRADGRLEILGRIDHQLKIRGFRVEPGEVEAAVTAHPAVRAAAVVGHPGAGHPGAAGDRRLVAYLLSAGAPPGAGELRRFLRRRLPGHLVPSIFLPAPTLPLTATGKVDRVALERRPVREPARAAPAVQVTPSNPTEEILTGIWSELLELEGLDVHEDFFDLGGHSLMATRVISRIRRTFDVDLPLRRLFERPTVAGLARAVAEAHRAVAPAQPSLEPGPRPSDLPLSFAQEGLWFLDRLEPGSSAYHLASAWRLTGPLDAGALDRSLRAVQRRHEVLRTRFPTIDDHPRQVVARSPESELAVVDLARLAPARRRAEARALAVAAGERSFDLRRGPVLRAVLLRLGASAGGRAAGEEQHMLLLTVHHIVSDAWSQGNLYRELASCYRAFSAPGRSRTPRLQELPVQYADFALWQRRWLRGEVLDAQLRYWRGQLAGSPPLLRLPTDRPRSAARSDRAGRVRWALAGEIASPLRQLSSAAGATLFMGMLAAFGTLLSRLSGQRDVLIGSPIANRGRTELEPLIGLFANTLVLRLDLSPSDDEPPSFRQLLRRVRRMALEAYARQDTPFERLVEALRPARSRSSSPLFQVMFALENAPLAGLELAGLACERMTTSRIRAKFDLSLSCREIAGGLEGELVYRAELFDAPRMRRMSRQLTTLVRGLAREPGRPLPDLPLLSAAERQQIMVEWNDTRTARRRRCLQELFELQVARTPDRIALVFEDQRLTYRQLNGQANHLARALAALGVGRGDVVPVLMAPCPEVSIALLATMKSGAAYAPLDVRWPPERISRILDSLDTRVVLVDESRRDGVWSRAMVVEGETGVGSTSDPALDPPVALEDAIYAIYTSGSTGEPKASLNTHGGIVNRLLWMDRHFGRDQDRVVLQTTYHTFDSSIWQLFWPLLHGGRAVMPALREGYDPDEQIGLLDRERVTFSDFVPSVLEVLVERLEQRPRLGRSLASLRQLIVGGEAINLAAVERFRSFFPGVGFTNLYGPTETAIGVTSFEIPVGTSERIPIGRPIDNVTVLILDEALRPVPIGVPGEIHLGGVCVGLGYLGEPELSRRSFIENPFAGVPAGVPGGKLYKTGDLARYGADGNIEFLGRRDDQIKLRGFRVEPAEIETALIRHPAVREAAVVVRGSRLVAYVVADRDHLGSPASGKALVAAFSRLELRTFLMHTLPDYMVPSELVLLETLPLNANGKVDRIALAANGESAAGFTLSLGSAAGAGASRAAPRTPVETRLAAIWSEVLGVGDVGPRDDFFAVGGHSLLAVRLMTLIERRFQVRLPLAALFDHPTLEGLAGRVAAGGAQDLASPLVRIRPAGAPAKAGTRPPFFCVHPVGGQVLCYRDLARHLGADQPFFGLQARGCDGEEDLDAEIGDMAERYLAAVRREQPRGPYRLGGWSMGGVVAFEIAHRLRRQGEKIAALILIDTSVPAAGPPVDELAARLSAFARNLGPVQNPSAIPAGVDLEDGLRRILAQGRQASFLPSDVDLRRLRAFFSLFENNLRAVRSYVPPAYPGEVTVLRCSERPADGDPSLGWSAFAAGGVEVHTVPGDHYTLLREPHVWRLAARLEELLARSGPGDQAVAGGGRLAGQRPEPGSPVASGALAGLPAGDLDLAEG